MFAFFKAIFKFCTAKKLFTFFKQRYTKQEIEDLNQLVKLRGKLRTARFSFSFLNLCLCQIVPKFITARISKAGVRQSPTIERAFLQDEIHKRKTNVLNLKCLYTHQWSKTRPFLSFLDNFRLCRYISEIDQRTLKHTTEKHNRNIGLLVRKRFGGMLSDTKKHIFNFSDYSLSDTETFVLGNGLEFCIPPLFYIPRNNQQRGTLC